MKDPIERQAAIDTLDKHLRMTDVPVSYPGIISALTEWLNELPSTQPEIIHCKDCRYSTDFYQDGCCYCKMPSKEMRYIEEGWDFYCAAGKENSDEKNLGESRNES